MLNCTNTQARPMANAMGGSGLALWVALNGGEMAVSAGRHCRSPRNGFGCAAAAVLNASCAPLGTKKSSREQHNTPTFRDSAPEATMLWWQVGRGRGPRCRNFHLRHPGAGRGAPPSFHRASPDRGHYRLGVYQVVRHGRGHLLVHAHLLLDGAFHTDQADAELVLQQFADRAHPTVAQVIDVVHRTDVLAQLEQVANGAIEIVRLQRTVVQFSGVFALDRKSTRLNSSHLGI